MQKYQIDCIFKKTIFDVINKNEINTKKPKGLTKLNLNIILGEVNGRSCKQCLYEKDNDVYIHFKNFNFVEMLIQLKNFVSYAKELEKQQYVDSIDEFMQVINIFLQLTINKNIRAEYCSIPISNSILRCFHDIYTSLIQYYNEDIGNMYKKYKPKV